MKAMIWKELRENVKWAVLAMIGLTLAEIYGLYYFDPMNYDNQGVTLCNPPFLMATSLGNAVVGLLLGFLQIIPEQRRDQWAALLHRPVSRGVIFRGKAAAGVLLYLLATVPPFLLCLWLAATPGHFVAPFVPGLVLPGLSDIFVGQAYYFAALVTALQRGSWFGARSFALLAAVYLSCSVSSLHFFYVAVEAAMILALILLTAAWGAMLSNGKFRDRPRLAQAALLLAVFFGVCGVGSLGSIMASAGHEYGPWTGAEYKITQAGVPFIFRTSPDLTTTVTELDGKPLPDPSLYVGQRGYQNEIQTFTIAQVDSRSLKPNPSLDNYNYRLSRDYVHQIEQYGELLPTQWFFLVEQKIGLGIERRTKRPSEVVDRTGFHPIGQPIVPFTGTNSRWYSSPALVQEGTDASIYDLEKEQVTHLTGADTSPICGLEFRNYVPAGGKGWDEIVIIARRSGLQVYDSNGAPLAAFGYDPKIDLERWGMIDFGNNNAANRFYVEYMPSSWLSWWDRHQMPTFLDEIDNTGTILQSYTLPPLPQAHWPRSWQQYLSEAIQSPAFWFWDLAYKKIGASLGIKRLADQANDSFNTNWGNTKELSQRILLFSLVFAGVALAWARRAGMDWPRVLAWTGFVFAFNLGGLIAFRCVADWPVQVRCPSCQRSRLVEEPVCAHCHAGWPAPPAGGFEIFDAATPAPAPERTT